MSVHTHDEEIFVNKLMENMRIKPIVGNKKIISAITSKD